MGKRRNESGDREQVCVGQVGNFALQNLKTDTFEFCRFGSNHVKERNTAFYLNSLNAISLKGRTVMSASF